MSEFWHQIPGFPDHEASSLGRVRRRVSSKGRPAGMILKQKTRPSGYAVVSISAKKHFVHRLVCAAFNGPPLSGQEVSHEDGNKANNSPKNLRWRSHVENERMKALHGTKLQGSSCHISKITEMQAVIIRSAYRLRLANQSNIASFFGVSRATVGDITSNRTWRHVE